MGCVPTPSGSSNPRLVGDPIDVVTGAHLDVHREFELPGPVPLTWRRHYDSGKTADLFGLGWGHAHEYGHFLRFDIDGIRYDRPVGRSVGFSVPSEDGGTAVAGGLTLHRVEERTYRLIGPGRPVMEFEFPAEGLLAPVTRIIRSRRRIEFRYREGTLVGIVDSLDRYIRVSSDSEGRVLELALLDRDGTVRRRLVRYTYDASGNLVLGLDAYGNEFHFEYDAANRMISRTDQEGYTFRFRYDDRGRCVHSAGQDGLHEVHLEYRPDEQRTVVTRGDGGVWIYEYAEGGELTSITDPYGGMEEFIPGPTGRVATRIRADGRIEHPLHSSIGDVLGFRDGLGRIRAVGDRDPHPEIPQLPPWPAWWEFGALAARSVGLPELESPSLELPRRVSRGLLAWTRGESGPNGAGALDLPVESDELGLVLRQSTGTDTPRRWRYDANGKVVKWVDYTGGVHTFRYSSWSMLAAAVDPLGHETTLEYTGERRVARVVDPGGTESVFEYDLKDRLVRVLRHGSLREEYRRDAAGRAVEKVDGEGRTLWTRAYDEHGRVVQRSLASGDEHEFAYDEGGRLAVARSQADEVTLEHTPDGDRAVDLRDGNGVAHDVESGRIVATTVLGGFTFRYEKEGRRWTVYDPAGRRHTVEKIANGLLKRDHDGRIVEHTSHDPRGRCLGKTLHHPRGSASSSGSWTRLYGYGREGELTRIEDSRRGPIRFQYDRAGRLESMTGPDGDVRTFRLDEAGNLLDQPGLSKVRLAPGNRIEMANGAEFQYDERHRMCRRVDPSGTTDYTYDSLDRLVGVTGPGLEWTAEYDALGRRVRTVVNGRRTEFYWDGDRLAAEIDPRGRVRIYARWHPDAVTPSVFFDYPSPNAAPDECETYAVFSNHLAAPTRVETLRGQVVWAAEVEPYGRTVVEVGEGFHMPLRFPGHYWDEELGLHHCRFRYYDPVLGRFLQPDPIDVGGGLNLYAYTDRPLVRVDLTGLSDDGCPPDTDGEEVDPSEAVTKPEIRVPPELREPPPAERKYSDKALDPLSEDWKKWDKDHRVVIFSRDERQEFRVTGGPDGRLVYADSGRPVDSSDAFEQKSNYVMDQDGNVYVYEKPMLGHIHHSSLAAGEVPVAAGEITQLPGQPPTMINNSSGHYIPQKDRGALAKDELSEQGVDMSKARDDSVVYDRRPDPFATPNWYS